MRTRIAGGLFVSHLRSETDLKSQLNRSGTIVPDLFIFGYKKTQAIQLEVSYHSASRTRTYDIMINSHALLPTELWRIKLLSSKNSPYGIRTRVTAVKRRCLNPLTNGPSSEIFISLTLLLLYQSIRFCLYFFSKKILNFAKFIRILR